MGLVLLVLISLGGATHSKRLAQPRNLFYEGQLEESHQQLTKLSKANKRDRDVVALDLAMVELLSGQHRQAETRLRDVRDRFDHLEQKSLAESTLSLWTDDQVKAYSGEDYEKIFVRSFLAIASLMQGGADAEAYSLQINEKQRDLADAAAERLGEDYAKKYAPVPLGFYSARNDT